MKKSNFFKMTFMLIVGGFITKLLGMMTKIIITRIIGNYGIGLYMMILPTFGLLVSISQFGFPIAISKLVAEEKYNNKELILSIFPLSIFINLTLMFLIFLISPLISKYLLHEPNTYLGLISISFTLPFIAISSILRAYYFGKEKVFIHVISNIMEDLIKLIIIILFLKKVFLNGISITIMFLILITIFSELSSIIIFLVFLPKRINLKNINKTNKKNNINMILNISIPTTTSRIIGSLGYFLEPIILTFTLLKCGYSNNYIISEYGIINGYVMPLLLLPSFFTLAISQALIPIISKNYANKNINETKRKIKQAIFYSLLIGIPSTLIFLIIPDVPLKLIYNTTKGIVYIKVLAPFFLFHYIQAPLNACLQAMGKADIALKSTFIGMITRTISLFFLSLLKINLWGLIFAIILNILITTFYQRTKVINLLITRFTSR